MNGVRLATLSGQESSMSTTLDGRKAKKNYAEFDEYISYQLQKTQTGIRSTDVFTALCGAAVFVVSYLLVFVVFDHWIVTGGFGPAMRVTLLAGLLLGTISWLGWKVAWPFFRRVNSLYAARVLEQASPELKSTLLNYVDLRSAAREVSPSILGSMEKRAAVTLSHTEIDDAIDRSLLLKLSYALLIAVVLFSIYSVASPKKVWPSIVRIFAPGAEVSVSTQTAFLKVTPGDTVVLSREFLTVTTDLSGEVPQDVTLHYTTADGQFVNEPVSMHEVEAGLKRYRCILKGVSGEGLLQNLSYRITAGDASTPDYHVTVRQPPSATVKSLRYRFPDYMELPPDEAVGSNVDTWEGTRIELTAVASMPVESAKLQFSDEAEFPARCEEMRMTVASDGVTLTPASPWQPIIREDGSYPRFFRIQCRTADGATDPTPAVHSIRLQADRRPDVSTRQPTRDLEVAANAIVPLLIQASDPDFRLSQIVLRMKNGNRSLPKQSLYKGDDREKLVRYDLKIADLNAMPGDVITWWIEAHDNRRVETASRILLDTNRRTTPQLKMTIKAAVPEEEVNQQLERDRQRAQDKLDELEQTTSSETAAPDDPGSTPSDQQSDSAGEPDPDNENPASEKNDEQNPAESSTDDQSNGGADGDGGKSGSEAPSDQQDGTGRKTEKSQDSSDGSGTGEKKPGAKKPTDPSDTEDSDSRSGSKKPVRNDGSQDDEILSELLKRDRDTPPEEQPTKGGQRNQSSNDSPDLSQTDPSRNDEDARNEESSGTSESKEPGSDSQSESEADGSSEKDSNSTNPKDAAKTPTNQDPDRSKNNSETGSSQPETPKENSGREKPDTEPETSESDNNTSPENPSDSSTSPEPEKQDSGKSDTQPSGNDSASDKPASSADSDESSSGRPESNDNAGDAGSSSSSSPSPGEKPSENSSTGKSSEKGNGNSASRSESGSDSGTSSSSNPSGKPGDGGTGGKNGSSSPSSTKPAVPSESTGTGQDGTPGSPSSSPSEKGSSSAAPNDSRDSETSPSSENRNQSASDQPGDGGQKDTTTDDRPGQQTENQTGRDPGHEGNDSNQNEVKPGADSSGNPADQSQSDSSSSNPNSGEPGNGQSSGGKPQGQPGSGQSTEQGGTPGQSTGGSTPRKGTSPDGDPTFQPDDNADVNDAVERPASGANVHDSSLTDADPSSLEDKLKASNMVLKRLQEELDRGDVDQELLKKLGWTEQDMRRFAERLERQLAQPKPNDPAAEARRRQFEETLRSVDLESSGRRQDGSSTNQKSTSNFTERRLPPPRSHRKAYEEYIRRLSRQRRGAPARLPQK